LPAGFWLPALCLSTYNALTFAFCSALTGPLSGTTVPSAGFESHPLSPPTQTSRNPNATTDNNPEQKMRTTHSSRQVMEISEDR
jgi:hypothetical protein